MTASVSYFKQHYDVLKYPIADESTRGLRTAQLGAIHAIGAHLTLDRWPGIVVLPTGSGKTAVLMMTAFLARAKRVLVMTPSRLVRGQIAEDFASLVTLKKVEALGLNVKAPHVIEVTSRMSSLDDWESLRQYDVVVSTPNALSPEIASIPPPPADLFDVLLIDEAHHSPAKTWNSLLRAFDHAHRFLFTATPFRRDRKEIEGKLIYSYSVKHAYQDKIFGDIEYVPVSPDSGFSADVAIAKATQRIFEEDRANGLAHLVMVRTDLKTRAEELKKIYEDHTTLRLRPINSSHSLGHIKKSIRALKQRDLDGIICVDMLGEGFDLPNLKIAAIHAPHRSLEVTLQFIGRFARTGEEKLGKARFLAVPSEIQFAAERLYEEGAAWQAIVQNLSQGRIQHEQAVRESLEKFSRPEIVTEDTEDLSLFALRPYKHVKIYRVYQPIDIAQELSFPPSFEIVFRQLSAEQSTAVFITKEIQKPRWTRLDRFYRSEYDLFVIHYHEASQLLFVNSSRRTAFLYEELVRQYSGGAHQILPLVRINRVLAQLESPEFFNIGMKNSVPNSRQESYRIITGSSAQNAIKESDGHLYHRGHVFGKARAAGVEVTIGYSTASKVWANTNAQIPELIEWCAGLAGKITEHKTVLTQSGLDLLSVGEEVMEFPPGVIAAEWNDEVFRSAVEIEYTGPAGSVHHCDLTDLEIQIDQERSNNHTIAFRIVGPHVNAPAEYSLSGLQFRFQIDPSGGPITVHKRLERIALEEYLKGCPPDFYFADFSRMRGVELFRAASNGRLAFDRHRITTLDWAACGVDITCEFVGKNAVSNGFLSIHDLVWQRFEGEPHEVVIYDHRSGEIADFVSFLVSSNEVEVGFYHCKASHAQHAGERVGDVYEVCGQVVKSIRWFGRRDLLEARLRRRLNTGSKFVKGDREKLKQIFVEMSSKRVRYQVVLVQPGLSCAAMTDRTAYVLAATDEYLQRERGEPVTIWGSV